jgi:hypothetical protein
MIGDYGELRIYSRWISAKERGVGILNAEPQDFGGLFHHRLSVK